MEEDGSVQIQRIGVDVNVEEDAEVVELHFHRLKYIENLEKCKKLKKLSLVSNIIHRIENLDENTELEHLDLYQNKITKMENLENLKKLRVLDLSFNEITNIENIEELVDIEELYLSNNHITQIENLAHLKKLTLLELGSNEIRDYGEVEKLRSLTQLWLGKNKLTRMNIPELPNLDKCSIQNNKVREWDECVVSNMPNITEFYLSYNKLTGIPSFVTSMSKLVILDLGNNRISKIHTLPENSTLEELWLNDNEIEDENEVRKLTSFTRLKVLYLERNPIQSKLGPSYRNRILDILPRLVQLDAIGAQHRTY